MDDAPADAPLRRNGSLRDVRVVFFDIDDTLYDFLPSYERPLEAVRTAWPEHFGHLDPQAFRDIYWRAYAALDDDYKWELIRTDISAYRSALWAKACEFAGIDGVDPAPMATLFGERRFGDMQPFAGVHALLRDLGRDRRVGIITNGPSSLQRRKLEGLKVEPYLDDDLVFVSEEFGEEKPSPRLFRAAVEAAGVEPHECVHVGDRLDADLPCMSVDMRFILFHGHARAHGVDPTAGMCPPDAVVRNYDELRALLLEK